MRLKRVRKGGKNQQNSPNEGKETDDDKIRRQLFIDVEKFGENVRVLYLNYLVVFLIFV